MKLTSSSLSHEGRIPQQFTCEGQNVSPGLSWMDAPKETKSFALIVHDPDAPRLNGFVHWVLYNIPSSVTRIDEDAFNTTPAPEIGTQGQNDAGKTAYMGPCPPEGTHRYFFRLYALKKNLDLGPDATYSQVIAAMEGTIIEQAELMGTYAKAAQKIA